MDEKKSKNRATRLSRGSLPYNSPRQPASLTTQFLRHDPIKKVDRDNIVAGFFRDEHCTVHLVKGLYRHYVDHIPRFSGPTPTKKVPNRTSQLSRFEINRRLKVSFP